MQALPPGLLDVNGEIFGENFKVWCLSNGERLCFDDFPPQLLRALEKKMSQDIQATACLIEWKVPEGERLERFTFCMYAGFDLVADFNHTHELHEPEYHNQCGIKDTCPYKGKLCTIHLKVKFGKLSPREIEVTRLIGKEYTDRQIAIELGISVDFVKSNHHLSFQTGHQTDCSAFANLSHR
ncbi:hypothetical protein [Pedobacter sp.]